MNEPPSLFPSTANRCRRVFMPPLMLHLKSFRTNIVSKPTLPMTFAVFSNALAPAQTSEKDERFD